MADRTESATLDLFVNGDQPVEVLNEMKERAKDLKVEIKEAFNSGNTALAKELTKQYNQLNKEIRKAELELTDVSKVLNNLSISSLKQLRQALSAVYAKMDSGRIKRNSEEWESLQKSAQLIKTEIKAIGNESALTESRLSRLSEGFNKYFAATATALAGITALSLTLRKLSEKNAKLDDIYADVMKTTAMTKEEVVKLNEELKKTDTRTTREELNKIAEEGGRIGIVKEDILEFTKAMNIAGVALGDSFKGGVEEIANTLGKLKFLFKETTDMQVEKAYLAIGSAINDLGANDVASEANIAEFATRIGSLPAALKPSIAATLALGAAFEEGGIESEVAARAYNIFLKQASVNAGKFASVMRSSRREVEEMIYDNPLEFFLKFAQGLRGMDATDVAKTLSFLGVNADGANKALGHAADKTERFRELISLSNKSFKEGVSVINEYNIKNNTLQASLDKARKAFDEAALNLGERLNPVLLKSTNLTTHIIKILPDIIDWFAKYGSVIIKLATIVASYVITLKAVALWEDRIRIKTLATAAILKLKTVWLKAVRSATLLYAAALHLLHGRLLTSVKALRLFVLSLGLNPIAAAVAAVVALGIAVYALAKKNDSLTQSMKSQMAIQEKVNERYAEQEANVNHLLNTLKNEKLALDKRREALEELKKIIPDYHADLTDEGTLIDNNTEAIKKYLVQLEKEIRLTASREELTELYRKKRTQQKEYEARKTRQETVEGYNGENLAGDTAYNTLTREATLDRYRGMTQRAKKELDQTLEVIKKIEMEVQQTASGIETPLEIETDIAEGSLSVINGIPHIYRAGKWELQYLVVDTSGGGENKALKADLKKEEDRYNQQKAELKKRYARHLEDEESFNRKMEEIETEHLEKEKAITEKHGENSAAIQDKIYDRIIKRTADEQALLDKLDQVYEQFDLKAAERDKVELIRIGQKFDSAKRMLDEGLDKQLLSREQHEELVRQLTAKRLEAEEKAVRDAGAKLAALEMKRLDVEKAAEEAAMAERHRKGLLSEGAYKESLLALEKLFLRRKLQLAGLSGEQRNELTKNLSLNRADTQGTKKSEREGALQKYGLEDIKETRSKEYEIIADFEARGVLSYQEALNAKAFADEKYLEGFNDKYREANARIQLLSSSLSSAVSGFQQAEEDAVSAKYDKLIAAAEGNAKKQAKLEEKKEKELAAIRAKHADKQFIVKTASIVASTAVAAMEAYAAMAGIPYVGPVLGAVAAAAAVAYGASQVAVAKQERDNAKKGYSRGGFTPAGQWDEPQGIVHSDEFVANRFAVKNPVIRRVFNIVDEAQKNNTVSSLSEKDFARALDYREAENRATAAGIAGAIAERTSVGEQESEMYALMIDWIQRNADATQRLNKRLDEPFTGEVYIDGPRGVKKNLDRYDKLIKNASR